MRNSTKRCLISLAARGRGYEEELYHDAISGDLMNKDLIEAARKVEMETSLKTRTSREGANKSQLGGCQQWRRGEPEALMQFSREENQGQSGILVCSNTAAGGHYIVFIVGEYALILGLSSMETWFGRTCAWRQDESLYGCVQE
jgi:hypothetical protein